jgi:hypothetical protein
MWKFFSESFFLGLRVESYCAFLFTPSLGVSVIGKQILASGSSMLGSREMQNIEVINWIIVQAEFWLSPLSPWTSAQKHYLYGFVQTKVW